MTAVQLVYAPSAKRVIPYPPVGVAMLAAGLRDQGVDVTVHDLEIELAARRAAGEEALLHRRRLEPGEAIAAELAPDVEEYAALLTRLLGGGAQDEGALFGISVMGFEQIASALLLARTALRAHRRVILGGQFFTAHSAGEAIELLAPYGPVSVAVGDGWEAVVAFAAGLPPEQLPNCRTGRGGAIVEGPARTAKSRPPRPSYRGVDWTPYERYGSHAYRRPEPLRRAHLYVWDKLCTFRCAFCRVASGSKAQLTPPAAVAESFADLAGHGASQHNFMTNELNPSRTYLRRLLDELERHGASTADWFTYIRADPLEARDFARIRALGGRLARYGVESGSQRLLDLMRKDYEVGAIERTLHAAAREDVFNHVNLLVGFPGEQESDIDETVDFLQRNAAAIHSVRINPFYLPPDTPLARTPEEFGIRLTGFSSGWWSYELRDGSRPDEDAVVRRIERIAQTCTHLGIGFAGTDPFFLLDQITRHPAVPDALAALRTEYPLFWVPRPTDDYKAMTGGYAATSGWRDSALKRQRNYALSICTD